MTTGPAKIARLGNARINLVALAKTQRRLQWCVLGMIGSNLLIVAIAVLAAQAMRGAELAAFVCLITGSACAIASIVFLCRLARVMGRHWSIIVLVALAMFVPLINLVVLMMVNADASLILKRCGVRRGILGVPGSEMIKLVRGSCTACGYDLRGNTTGVCPECATAFDLTKLPAQNI